MDSDSSSGLSDDEISDMEDKAGKAMETMSCAFSVSHTLVMLETLYN